MKRNALWRRVIDAKYGSRLGWCSHSVQGPIGLVCEIISGRGGMIFILVSSLRWGVVLLLDFGMTFGVRDFLWKIFSQSFTILLVTRKLQWLSCYYLPGYFPLEY